MAPSASEREGVTRVKHRLRIYAAPLGMMLAIVIGLIAALVGGARWYPLTWLALVVPLVIIARFLWRGGRRYKA